MNEIRHQIFASFVLALTLLIFVCRTGSGEESEPSAEELAFFENKIRPVLVEHCYECHSVDSKSIRGGLLLDTAKEFQKGGDSGPAIVPGHPGDGTLLDALKHETFEMPPKQKLPEQIIKDFEKWISMGAPDPRKGDPKVASRQVGMSINEGREFWSFQPIQEVPLPNVEQTNWPKSSIDRFILAKQEELALQPGNDAADLVLLRRLYFDLIGIPPTVQQILKFQKKQSEDRWEEIVDELLASREFGERWGRHWLDLARYSDSTGGGRSLLYADSWRYRNYVIDSFNADKPYDRFIREQIAGDLLEAPNHIVRADQIVGTGFLALGPHNYENQDKEQLRMDIVDEQIDTVGRVFLAMTLGCARCHDHKFDPVPTADYYALAGIFRSTNSLVDGNVSRWVSTPIPESPEQTLARAKYHRELESLESSIKETQTQLTSLKSDLPAILVDTDKAELIGNWTESQSIKGYIGKNYLHSSDLNAKAIYNISTSPGRYEVQVSYTPSSNRSRKASVLVQHSEGQQSFTINQKLSPKEDGTFHSLGEFTVEESLTVTIQPTEKAPTIADAVRLIAKSDLTSETLDKLAHEINSTRQKLTRLQDQLKDLNKTAPPKPQGIVSVEEVETPEDYFINIRGNVHNLGAPVKRGFLSVIESSENASIPEAASGRLELANWIASPENPLTARVFVNRVWHQLFGAGIVRTVDNFGIPGEEPSHSELLDFLANEFMNNGWSTKKLIRSIVLSRTYQLSSMPISASSTDPDNRLLTHQNRKRLTAEAIHDALFSISGELDPEPSFRSMRPGTRSEYGYQFDFGKRAIYLPVFRNRLPDILTVFDFPNPNAAQGKRTSSTVSPQSLFIMNSDFVFERSTRTAERALSLEVSDEERIEWLTLTILNRYPTSDETRLLSEFLESNSNSLKTWTQISQTLFGSLDFRFVD